MKKRILSILLLCCMVLTLLPTAAFAAGKIWVGTEEELLAALADNTIDKITLTADITVSQTLVIDRQVVLVLDHSLKVDWEQSSSGTLFHITKSGYLDTNAGSITDNVLNEGRFFPRQISGEVINEGEIIRGSFSGKVKNRGSINYGSFRGEVENAPGGKIANGELYGEVTNHGEISGWKFYGKVTNDTDGLITSGEFYGEVVNNGRITGGEFSGDVVNNGEITGGSFFGTLTGDEIQDNAYIAVTFDSDGGSTVAAQRILRGQKAQRPADPIKDGHTFIGWYNKADLQYINMPEWNFDYPVFKNLELVAQWMEARPISTDPITYLDKDGNQQVCTAYTVLTSETKESILNYTDKWYDLPAGWYVVEGNVTITPRLDTHGAVNLILTNGSQLTAEWGIDVKVGDTFTVYAQSTDEGTMGGLTACLPADFNLDRMTPYSVWPYYGMAGIGSSARWRAGNDGIRESEGTIIINGGNIRAKGQDNASAIGGTRAEEIEFRSTDRGKIYNRRQGGSITINGGVVRTEAFAMSEGNCTTVESVGIGTCQMGYGGSVTINGGTVIAEATCDAITTGYGGTITINGGDVTAIGGVNNFAEDLNRVIPGNGIGPYESGSVTINGGTVKASAKGNGFGIGGARIYNTGAMTVTINGGEIEATANRNNAAIGDKGKGKSGVTINGGVIHAVGKGSAAGIGSKGDIRITGGELTVSAEGSGAAIGGFTDSYSERVDCKSITINGDVIQSISSKDGACIGGAAGGSVGSITISDAELPLLSSNKILIGWDADSPGGKLTIRNCRVASTDTLSVLTDGIRVGSNSELVIENSEIRLPHLRGIRVGGNGSIAVRDSDLHTYGIFMDETVHTITDAKTLKKLEITDSTVLTGDIIGARGEYSSVEEIVIRGSSIRLNDEYTYNYCTIGGGTNGSFGSIDIQNSQIHIPSPGLNTAIGNGHQAYFKRESRIRIANSQVFVGGAKFGPAIGAAYGSSGGQINILIENSTVTAKGGNLRSDTDYIPGIGKNSSGRASEIGKIQILNSTVESFRLEEKDGTNYVYDDLHTKELPGIPAENITICGSTVNGTRIDHSFDEYGKCTLCGKYDLGYCYESGRLTIEGLTDCVSDGSEKKLTGLSHQTGENETKQLAENTDYIAVYSNNVHPYTLKPDNEGFDSEKAPKVTLYGTGNYCGKAEHYFTISAEAPAAEHTVTVTTAGNGTASAIPAKAVAGVEITLTAKPDTGYRFKEWEVISGGVTIKDDKFTMPDSDVEVKAIFEKDAPPAPTEFTITVRTDGNGTASASHAKAVAGTEITLTATPNEGYRFKEWQVISGGVTIKDDKFTMPDSDVEVKAIFEKDAPPAPTEFTITVKTDGNGTASASPAKAVAGAEIILTVTPNEGYHFKEWQVMRGNVTIKDDKFTMPDSEVEIKAIFEKDAPSAEDLVDLVIRIQLSSDGGYYSVLNGTWTAADFFQPGKAPKGAKITAVTPPTSHSIPVSVNVDSDGTLSCTKAENTTEPVLKSETYTVTITSDDYAPISAPLTVRQYLDAGFEGSIRFNDGLFYGDTYTYTCKVTNPGENGVWSALIQDPQMFEIYKETTDTTSEPGKSIYTVHIRAIKAVRTSCIDFLYLSDTTMASSKDSSDAITGGAVSTRPLTVMAGSTTITEGDALPTDLVSCTGLLDSEGRTDDRDTVLENALSYKLFNANNEEIAADTARNTPGTYTVVPAAALKSGWDERYSFNRVNGTLAVENKVEEQFTVTVTSGGNGTASASPAKAVAGTTITLTAMPNAGYHFKKWQVTSGNVTITSNKFNMPSANVEVKAVFEEDAPPAPTEFIVTFDGNGGTPSVGSMTTTNQKLSSLPSASRSGSYSFDGWYTKKSGGTKITTDTVFSADTTVYAHWTYTGGGSSGYSYYTIKATAGTGGSISPSGNVSVREGGDQTFTITPDKGYAVSTVKIDGKSIGAVKSYTFENVSRTHTIEVIFVKGTASASTGDSSNLPLWCALLLASTITLAGAVHYKRKRAR